MMACVAPPSPAPTEVITDADASGPSSDFYVDAMVLMRMFHIWADITDMPNQTRDHCRVIELFIMRDILGDENRCYLRTIADLFSVVIMECDMHVNYDITTNLVNHLCEMIKTYV